MVEEGEFARRTTLQKYCRAKKQAGGGEDVHYECQRVVGWRGGKRNRQKDTENKRTDKKKFLLLKYSSFEDGKKIYLK